MTPKEKAEDLWLTYYELVDDIYSNEAAKKNAKMYALIAVDEIIEALENNAANSASWLYYEEVKQEIEAL